MMDEALERAVKEVEQQITLPELSDMLIGKLPDDMVPNLAVVIALTRMLMTALQQNQEMAQRLTADDETKIIIKH